MFYIEQHYILVDGLKLKIEIVTLMLKPGMIQCYGLMVQLLDITKKFIVQKVYVLWQNQEIQIIIDFMYVINIKLSH